MDPEIEKLTKGEYPLKNLKFYKYHGLGNDFIIINDMEYNIPEELKPILSKKLCNRNFFVGADGLLFICDTTNKEKYDIRYRMFNPDGSEAEMCGNGIRCFAKHLFDFRIVEKNQINVETKAGLIIPILNFAGNEIKDVTVDMGEPEFRRNKIPVAKNTVKDNDKDIDELCLKQKIDIGGKEFEFSAVSMGNPHAVIIVDKIDMDEVRKYGPMIETNKLFPNRINVEFVQLLSKTEANFAVWERGAGVTMACGTGASASVAIGVKLKKFDPDVDVLIHLAGGDLRIKYTNKKIFMTGPAILAFEGTIKTIYI